VEIFVVARHNNKQMKVQKHNELHTINRFINLKNFYIVRFSHHPTHVFDLCRYLEN